MPTFQLFKSGKMLEEIQGANSSQLERLVKEHDVEPKAPSEMTVKELKAAVVNAGLAQKALGFHEKHEFVELLEEYYSKL